MIPTDKQIKKFWRWCGFKCIGIDEMGTFGQFPSHGLRLDLHLDLNNLFLYAVPKLHWISIEGGVSSYTARTDGLMADGAYAKTGSTQVNQKDPVLALFWAIWQVIEGEVIKDSE